MFSLDRWQEIFDTITRNKLRTALTSLSVAWGIFMLVLLLGAGTGLQNSVAYNFRDDAVNSIWVRPGQTSLPFQGHAVGRRIDFDNSDYEYIKNRVPGVEYITGRFYLRGERLVTYENKTSGFNVRAVHPDHRYLENTIVTRGRFIDDIDLDEQRKVAVIGKPIAAFFFDDGKPLGKWLGINGIPYQVVGVFEDYGADREMQQIYIPISTAQLAYGGGDHIHHLMFTVGDASVAESRAIEDSVRELLANRHQFSPKDKRALRVRNNLESFQEINDVFKGIEIFVWFVGLGTIVAGIVGVSNIMLISVKERTKEIGIRKALGATPGNIIGQIVQESVFLTAVSGYLGIVAGIGVFELIDRYVPDNDYIRDPNVDLSVAVAATALLVIAGALAGYFPARQAAKVDPVVALRDE
jgi:putative ABC transport system permease protein